MSWTFAGARLIVQLPACLRPRPGILRTRFQISHGLVRRVMYAPVLKVSLDSALSRHAADKRSTRCRPVDDDGGHVRRSGAAAGRGAAGRAYHRTGTGRASVVVSGANHRIVATVAVIRITRAEAGGLVTMRPSTDGAPPQVSALYSGGGTTGVEFVYGNRKNKHLPRLPHGRRPRIEHERRSRITHLRGGSLRTAAPLS